MSAGSWIYCPKVKKPEYLVSCRRMSGDWWFWVMNAQHEKA